MRYTLAAAMVLGLSGGAMADQVGGLVTDPPGTSQPIGSNISCGPGAIVFSGKCVQVINENATGGGPPMFGAPPIRNDQTWLIQMVCTAAPGAGRSCEEYPGQTTTYTSNADLHSQDDCRTVATAVARKYHYMSGNDYAFRCIVSDYQPKELEAKAR